MKSPKIIVLGGGGDSKLNYQLFERVLFIDIKPNFVEPIEEAFIESNSNV